MLSYLVHFLHAFIPASLVAGMLLALWSPLRGEKALRPLLLVGAGGLLAAAVLYPISVRQETLTAARTFLYGAAMLAAVLNALSLLLPDRLSDSLGQLKWLGALFFQTALAAVCAFSFVVFVSEQALSAVTVLNTELILNIAGVLAGGLLAAALAPVAARLGSKSSRKTITALLLVASLLLAVQWSAEVLLGMMRLELIELTSIRLSVVAKVTKYLYVLPYVQLLLLAILAVIFYLKRGVVTQQELARMQKAQRRKSRALVIVELRWFKGALFMVCFTCAVFLYYDLHASRPPKITPPVMLAPDAAGQIRIKTEQVKDGKLHRFAMVTDDGHVVRFFLINKSLGQGSKLGVVYDACMLCGDMGYIQEKNEVICIACNVRIFLPSIGKAGGCNPIPLVHSMEGDHVVISVEELDKGARYFSEVVSRKVKDPVTGKELENTKAPYRHEYKGRTYFFESEESGEKFQRSPESYLGDREARYYRTQGFRETN